MKWSIYPAALLLLVLGAACSGSAPPPASPSSRPWLEEEIAFSFGQDEMYGILTLPVSEGPHPAIVMVSGSANISTGLRSGASSQYFIGHARRIVLHEFAVLRYDPPGAGRSSGASGLESLDLRAEEAVAALQYLRSRPDIDPDRVGLMGNSQGGWVIAMAAAQYPQDVAFIVSVSGSGVSVAEQQVHSIESQSKAAGMSEEEVTRAVLFGRLLIDWQLATPVYREVNEATAQALSEGPWTRFANLVYEPGKITAAQGLQKGIEILKSVQNEPWARFLYLKELYLPQLESISPEEVEAAKALTGQSLLVDPRSSLTRVRCPVLAVFGEDDLLQPTEKSSALYDQYLTEAGNDDFKIVVIAGVGHSIGVSTLGYWEALSDWLDRLDPD